MLWLEGLGQELLLEHRAGCVGLYACRDSHISRATESLGQIITSFFHAAGVVGFEQDNYTVSEADGFAEVCVIFTQPAEVQLENNEIVLAIQSEFQSGNGSAEGN